ncbi:Scr1 family TA system antitoxin-like transcriptional regulator [Streptomyces sp. NPDC048611]|uniref:helix-turn-helix domain-containing protein n=1 Tax=Streptomyces sp. NPDC048611 TaxID=3155635 RepID=UPI003437192A
MGRPPKKLDPTAGVAELLGSKVRELRESRGWSQGVLAGKVFTSVARIAGVELATDPPNADLCQRLDETLEAKGALMELFPLLRRSQFEKWAEVFLDKQAQAVKIYEYSQSVPGLLQTPGYARAMLASGRIFNSDRDLDEVVQARLERQEILRRPTPPWMWVILAESALHFTIGGRQVMREQLEYLLEVATSDRVHIRVLPYEGTVPMALGGSLSLLVMPRGEQVAYVEGLRMGNLIEGEDATPYTVLYDHLHGNALGPDESADMIRKVLEEKYQ